MGAQAGGCAAGGGGLYQSNRADTLIRNRFASLASWRHRSSLGDRSWMDSDFIDSAYEKSRLFLTIPLELPY